MGLLKKLGKDFHLPLGRPLLLFFFLMKKIKFLGGTSLKKHSYLTLRSVKRLVVHKYPNYREDENVLLTNSCLSSILI